jgi:iron complex outermembrane receptor protein
MSTNLFIQRAVRCALFSGAVTALTGLLPAQAQQQQQQETQSIQEVVVTGSRIAQPNLTSVSPVTAVSSDQIKIEGVTRTEDLINNLPQAFADFGGNVSNGATGAATVNLRGLGSQRTLVLVNNRRLMPGDPTQNGAASPDLNQIPAALISRVDVLTGGASAVYGADAVAGVVNFIMNDKFEGVRVDAQYGLYQHDNNDSDIRNLVRDAGFTAPDGNTQDGYSKDITFLAGINTEDGRGNATVYLGYRTLSAVTQNRRDFSACALGSGDTFSCGGSGTTAPALFQTYNPSNPNDLTPTGTFTLNSDGTVREFQDSDLYNFAPSNYYQRPDERRTAGLFAHYDFSDKATVYTEFMFMDDRTDAQVAPSGAFLGSGPGQPPFFGRYAVNCDNPLLSPSAVTTFCGGNSGAGDVLLDIGRRNVEGGGRLDDLRHTSFRGVLGLRGDIADGWNYDVYGLYGTSILSERFQNDISRTRLNNALLAVTGPNGQPVCRINADASLTNDDPTCVPYAIFGVGSVTQDQLNYLQVPGLTEGETVEQVLSGSISGDLGQYGLKLPTANDGLAIAFGAEYRSERSELRADEAFQTGDLAGQGAPTLDTNGQFDVKEVFAEARLPLVQGKPFADTLSFETGYRYSDYDLGFKTDTYKLGLQWAPVAALMFRGSYQRAVRSPNIQELFLLPRVQLDGNTDPCSNALGETPGASFEECARSGVTQAQYGNILQNPSSQYNGLVGGNTNLDPEKSDTYSFGFVFTPDFLPNFSATIDYYDIKVDKLINSLGADFILNQCLTSGDPTFCDRVHRSANGSIWLGNTGFIDDPILNTGSLQTTGLDAELNYRFDVGAAGSLAVQLVGTYVDKFLTEPLPGASRYDCVGLYGTVCGTPTPDWRHKLRATWTTPWDLDLSLTWRYIAAIDDDRTSSDPNLTSDVIPTDKRLGARGYLDAQGSYSFSEVGVFKSVNARLGINNLLDKDPPLVGQDTCPAVFCNGNTFPQVYDTLGRFVFLGLTADF